uniref:Uncharacterized protein n=1 Tax=Anguilla anguilla TaxID=7936 RepID=A0A0E9XVJ4_ANGAN
MCYCLSLFDHVRFISITILHSSKRTSTTCTLQLCLFCDHKITE